MRRWFRITLTALSFFQFFLASIVMTLVLPIVRFFFGWIPGFRNAFTSLLAKSYRLFIWWLEITGLIKVSLPDRLPDGIDADSAFVIVANHPTLIDVLVLLANFPKVSCVAKGAYYRSWVFKGLLRSTNYVPSAADDSTDTTFDRVVEHLKSGRSILIFPEGTRSEPHRLQRFRRGALEAAAKVGVPILPAFMETNQPFLMKGVPFWKIPTSRCDLNIEFFEPIELNETSDVRAIHKKLSAKYSERFARMREERHETVNPVD